ncbi:MAG: DMT family transporter [Rhodobacteraceae bacterium]|nr:DMT family transporter [Paracoccaceae bacterium]
MGLSNTTRGYILSMLAFGFFSTHDAIIKVIGAHYSVFQIILFSSLFAFIPLTVMMMMDRNLSNYRPRHPWLIALRSVLSVVGMSSAFYAFTVLPMTEVYALLFITPLLITALSVPLLGEVVRLQRWMAIIVGLIGVMVVLRPGSAEFSYGHGAALVAAFTSAMTSIIIRKIGSEERSAVLILIPMISSIAVMAAVMPFVYIPVQLPHLGMMALVGVFAVGAQVSIIGAYRVAPSVALIAPVQYTQILWATLFGVLFFGEAPDKWVAIGASIIISSGLFIVWRESHSSTSDTHPVLRTSNPRPDTGPSIKPKSIN